MTIRIPVRSEPHGDLEIDSRLAPLNGGHVRLIAREYLLNGPGPAEVPANLPIVRLVVRRTGYPRANPTKVFAEIAEGAEHMPRLVEWWPPRARRGIVEYMRKWHLEAEAHRKAAHEHRAKAAEIVNIFHKDAELERAAARGREADEIVRLMALRVSGLIDGGRVEAKWADKWAGCYDWSWAEMVEREPDPGVMY